jgi:hypothetical protein
MTNNTTTAEEGGQLFGGAGGAEDSTDSTDGTTATLSEVEEEISNIKNNRDEWLSQRRSELDEILRNVSTRYDARPGNITMYEYVRSELQLLAVNPDAAARNRLHTLEEMREDLE